MQLAWTLLKTELYGENNQNVRTVRFAETSDGWIVLQVIIIRPGAEFPTTKVHEVRLDAGEFVDIHNRLVEKCIINS